MTDNQQYSLQEIAELFDIAGREGEAIRQLAGCVNELLEVQNAKATLLTLNTDEVREALAFRRLALGGQAT